MSIKATIEMDPRVKLKAKRTLEGNILILDHEDIDIVLLPEKKKCIAFPKDVMSEKVYASQDRLYKFLAKKGILSHSTVRGGNVFGALEADIFESKIPGVDSIQAFLLISIALSEIFGYNNLIAFKFIPMFEPNSKHEFNFLVCDKIFEKKFKFEASNVPPLFLSIYSSPKTPAQNSS